MGILGFLQFSLYCVKLFAWPILALVYPLFASIRAIETNSNYHMKKLVTYWIIFSLIYLFEITFAKPLQWCTVWPYLKLIAICWLATPRFGHAYYAYTSIVQMRTNAKMQCFVDWLIKQDKVKTVDAEEFFVSVVKKFIKENGSEALEELISNKPKVMKANVDAKEIMGPVEKKEKATPVEAKQPEGKVAENETRRAEFVEMKERNKTPILITPTNLPSGLDKVQKQWTCAVCQVTTSSEVTLNSHLQGQRHILKCAELNAKRQAHKEKYTAEARNTANKNLSGDHISDKPKVMKTNVDVKEIMGPVQKKEKSTPVEAEQSEVKLAENELRKAEFVEMKERNKTLILPTPTISLSGLDKVQKQWTCAVCQVTTSSEITLNSHLQGQRHILKCAELNAKRQARKEKYTAEAKRNVGNNNLPREHTVNQHQAMRTYCMICNVSCSGSISFNSHLYGKKHLSKVQELTASVNAVNASEP